MKKFIPLVFGAGAISALLAARSLPIATVPMAGSVRLVETLWGGGPRVTVICSLLAMSIALSLSRRFYRVSLVLAGIAAGILIDMAIGGWAWYHENLALLESMGASRIAKGIRLEAGAYVGAGAAVFVLIYLPLLLPCWVPREAPPDERLMVF